MIILMTYSLPENNTTIEEENSPKYQLGGGGGSIEERCSSITFEDILPYTHAHFDLSLIHI